MNRISNKEKEEHYFKMFRKNYPLPSDKITHINDYNRAHNTKYSGPDFVMDGEKLIGIEMTIFYIEEGGLPESEQRQRDLREETISEAHSIYQKEKRKKIQITFGFDKENPIQNKRELVKKLVDLARSIENFETGTLNKDLYQTIPELAFVYLNAKEYDNAKWRINQLYTYQIMSRDRLVEIVIDKEECSKQYKKCKAYWLLIVVDGFDRAQDQSIPIDGFDKIETDVFEKVIVYEPHFGRVLELQCVPSKPSGDSSKGTPDICN